MLSFSSAGMPARPALRARGLRQLMLGYVPALQALTQGKGIIVAQRIVGEGIKRWLAASPGLQNEYSPFSMASAVDESRR